MKSRYRFVEQGNSAENSHDAHFSPDGRQLATTGVCALGFVGKRRPLDEVSGCLRPVSGPKQFQQVVGGTDQLPFRAGFHHST